MKILFHPLALLLGISLLLGSEFSVDPIPDYPPETTTVNSTLIGQGTDIKSALADAGLDISALPPLAWRCVTKNASMDIKQKFHSGGLLVYDVNGTTEVHNVSSGSLITHPFTFPGTGSNEVKIHFCSDDVSEIDVTNQGLIELEVAGLSGLESLKGNSNEIDGTVSLMGCSSLETVQLAVNHIDILTIDATPNAYPGLKNLHVYSNEITNDQDLTGCPALEYCRYSWNSSPNGKYNVFEKLYINGLKNLHTIYAQAIGINNAQDLEGCDNLEYCYMSWNNNIPELKIADLDNLKIIEVYGNVINGTVDIRGCSSLVKAGLAVNQIDNLLLDTAPGSYPALTDLYTYKNEIVNDQDLRGCPALVHCRYSQGKYPDNPIRNEFDSLHVDNLSNLKTLYATGIGIANAQNLEGCTALQTCYMSWNNHIPALKIAGLGNLKTIEAAGNVIDGEVDITGCGLLQRAVLSANKIDIFTLSTTTNAYPNLTDLLLYSNEITNPQDLRGCSGLVNCYYSSTNGSVPTNYNNLGTLNIENLSNLTILNADGVGIGNHMNLTGCTNLTTCLLNNNSIPSVDMTNLTLLNKMELSLNQLSTVDFSGCEVLATVRIDNNQLTSITLPLESNVPYQIPFGSMNVSENQLSEGDMNTFMINFKSHTDAAGTTTTSGNYLNVDNSTTTGSYTANTQSILSIYSTNGWTVFQ